MNKSVHDADSFMAEIYHVRLRLCLRPDEEICAELPADINAINLRSSHTARFVRD